MRSLRGSLIVIALSLGAATWALAQYDFAAETEELAVPGETVQQAATATKQALQATQMKVSVSAVGFQIDAGSEAERYLKDTASIGRGGYFTAASGGQLVEALGAAASGQTGTAGSASADAVRLTKPVNGDSVGPSMEIAGSVAPNALVVVYTTVVRADTNEQLKDVPGIRHRAESTGSFSFRIATPRVSFGTKDVQVRYIVHAYVLKDDGKKGPETTVTVQAPTP
jgi:hypothetical protein